MQSNIAIPLDRIRLFCDKWGVKEFSLFGSVLRDDFRPDSDVDVMIELRPDHGLSLFDWIDMIDELKSIFGRDVDLIEKTTLRNPFRRRSIMRSHEVIYAA